MAFCSSIPPRLLTPGLSYVSEGCIRSPVAWAKTPDYGCSPTSPSIQQQDLCLPLEGAAFTGPRLHSGTPRLPPGACLQSTSGTPGFLCRLCPPSGHTTLLKERWDPWLFHLLDFALWVSQPQKLFSQRLLSYRMDFFTVCLLERKIHECRTSTCFVKC